MVSYLKDANLAADLGGSRRNMFGNPLGGDFTQLCKLGFALNWPLVLLGLGIFLLLLLRR